MSPPPQISPDAASRIMAAIAAPEAADPQFPAIDGYIIESRVGDGGAGEVYRAYRHGSDRPVAIKLMRHTRALAPQGRAWRELELLSQLRLHSLPRMLDYGISGGRLYIVTDFVEGERLHERAQRLTLRERVELLARVADAVQSLHEHGVIHRDIKPSNILVDAGGNPVIIDFGIATLLASDPMETLTQEGTPIGTPAYMAPEQARGDRGAVSTRTDIYGLGATAFTLLVGATPHDTSTTLHEAVRRVAQDAPREARALDPTLPKPLGAVLMKAVARDPEERYASAALLAMDLRRWLAGERVLATPAPRYVRVLRLAARHPVAASVIASTALGLGIIGGSMAFVWYINGRPAEIELDRTGNARVRLKSESGRTLHMWDAGTSHGIIDAVLMDRDVHFGGGKLALVAFGLDHQPALSNYPTSWTGLLCAFSPSQPDQPLWSNHVALLPAMRYATEINGGMDEFRPMQLGIADVFPERPGREIILVSCHRPYSPTAIQILDQAGELLYEAWHDGHLYSMYWMAESRLLVLAGCDSDGRWEKRGEPGRALNYPLIVMAIRPQLGESGVVFAPEGRRGGKRAEWYNALLPAAATDLLDPIPRVMRPFAGSKTGRRVQLTVSARLEQTRSEENGQAPELHWIFDESGAVVERAIGPTWERSERLPDPAEFYFASPPPKLPEFAEHEG